MVMASQPSVIDDSVQGLLDDIADLPFDQQIRYLMTMTDSVSVRRQRVARALLVNNLDQLADDNPRHAKA